MWLANLYLSLCALTLNFGRKVRGSCGIQYGQQHPGKTICRSHRLHNSQCQFSQCDWPICIFLCVLSLWILADKSVCHMEFYLASRIPYTQSGDPINFIGPLVNSINVTGQFVSFLVCTNFKFWQKNPWVIWYSIGPAASRIHNLPIPST